MLAILCFTCIPFVIRLAYKLYVKWDKWARRKHAEQYLGKDAFIKKHKYP